MAYIFILNFLIIREMVFVGVPAIDILVIAFALATMNALVTKVTLGEIGRAARE